MWRGREDISKVVYFGCAQVLRGRSTCPGVWDQLVMDLSSVYFTMGTVLQNNAPLSSLTPQDVCS